MTNDQVAHVSRSLTSAAVREGQPRGRAVAGCKPECFHPTDSPRNPPPIGSSFMLRSGWILAMILEMLRYSELGPRSLLDREGGKTHLKSVMATITPVAASRSPPFQSATTSARRGILEWFSGRPPGLTIKGRTAATRCIGGSFLVVPVDRLPGRHILAVLTRIAPQKPLWCHEIALNWVVLSH